MYWVRNVPCEAVSYIGIMPQKQHNNIEQFEISLWNGEFVACNLSNVVCGDGVLYRNLS